MRQQKTRRSGSCDEWVSHLRSRCDRTLASSVSLTPNSAAAYLSLSVTISTHSFFICSRNRSVSSCLRFFSSSMSISASSYWTSLRLPKPPLHNQGYFFICEPRFMNSSRSSRCTSCSFFSSAPYSGGISLRWSPRSASGGMSSATSSLISPATPKWTAASSVPAPRGSRKTLPALRSTAVFSDSDNARG